LPRIRMMQQCLPAGNPMARPLDLFERQLPSLWHMHCNNAAGQWDVVGLFNFENQPQERTLKLTSIGLAADDPVVAFEFWEEKMLGVHKEQITLKLAPHTARVLIIHRLPTHPQIIATNMHMLGGYHEISRQTWNEKSRRLAGQFRRVAGLEGTVFLYIPDGFRATTNSASLKPSTMLSKVFKNLSAYQVEFKGAQVDWAIEFALAARPESN
jgi:hypothetical protein